MFWNRFANYICNIRAYKEVVRTSIENSPIQPILMKLCVDIGGH